MVGLMLSVATIGCVKTDDPTAAQTGVLRLQLSNGEHSTRADGDAEDTDPFNEFKLATAQVFFLDASDNVLESHYVADLNAVQEETVTIPLSAEQLTDLFDNGKGHVYVIANYGSEIDDTDDTTNSLAELKKLAIGFEETSGSVATQSSFVMDSEPIEVTYDGQDKTISGEVPLTRAAAKIELTVNVAPLTQDGKTWTANTGAMTVTLHNGVKDGIVDDDSDGAPKAAQADATLFNDSRQFSGVVDADGNPITVKIDGVTYTQHVQTIPFYSYSTKWNAGDDDEVYLEVAIPWKVSTGSDDSYQTFYYQVPVSVKNLALVRNNFYQLTLTVGVLGGLTERVTVEPSYTVFDWGSQEVNVNLSRPKYLVVDENYVVMDNIMSYSVGYQSSDDVTAYLVGFKCSYYYDPTPTTTMGGSNPDGKTYNVTETWSVNEKMTSYNDVLPNIDGAAYKFSVSLDKTTKQVTLNHDLDNVMPDKIYHHFPYEVTVRVTNTTAGFYEDITFRQNPAMYVSSKTSSGNVIINNNKSNSVGSVWWYNYAGFLNSKNLYTITVSAFDESTANYIITDPRVPSNTSEFEFYQASSATSLGNEVKTAVDATNVTTTDGEGLLHGYRKTISGTDSQNLIAPSFMMASSAGAYNNTKTLTPDGLVYRCAAYQEDGYPAGRWRLPTPAELEIVGRLCSEGKLESIFYDGLTYASSNGLYTYNSGSFTPSNETMSTSVRCVYDVWYWKDKCKTNTQFIWGAEENIADMKANGTYNTYMTSVE